ncbi:MAG: AhpC/TSA family protein [Prevotella sp.]|nr:AhpC/TSA family protein [Prevotella sp.]
MMRKILTAIGMILTTTTLMAQDMEYSVTGEVYNALQRVYLYKMGFYENELIDSANVEDGVFSLQGVAPQGELLAVGDAYSCLPFFNDGTPISLVVHKDVEDDLLILEPFEFTEASEQNKHLAKIDIQIGNMLRSLSGSEEDEMAVFITANTELNLLKENITTMVPLVYLPDIIDVVDYDSLAPLMDSTTVYFKHPAMRDIYEYYVMKGKCRLGIPFHDATLQDVFGRQHRLSDYCGRGNYVLLDFWASWCTPCLREMPNLKDLYNKYHGTKNFEIVGISLDNDVKSWRGAIQRLALRWPQLSDLMVREGEAVQKYGVVNIPANVLLDPQGQIIGVNLLGEDLTEYLAELME